MTATDDSYSLTQLRELKRMALALGFMDDALHWEKKIRQATDREYGSIQGQPVGGDPSFGQNITIREYGSSS